MTHRGFYNQRRSVSRKGSGAGVKETKISLGVCTYLCVFALPKGPAASGFVPSSVSLFLVKPA